MLSIPQTTIQPDAKGAIQPDAIEKTLRNLWRDIAASGTTLHVRTLNLLVYMSAPPDAALAKEINDVAVQSPGRTVTLQTADGPPLAEATIACRIGGSLQACGEKIMLQAPNPQALHNLALALLQPGLPVVVWWHGAPAFIDPAHAALVRAADHILLDSRTWPDPLPFLPLIAAARRRDHGVLRLSDLQWVALTPWRQLIAQAFDAPTTCTMLPQATRLVVEYGGPAYRVGALLLAGWFATRLGWRVADDEGASQTGDDLVIMLRTEDDRPLTLTLRHHAGDHGVGGVELHSTGEPPAHFVCHETPDAANVTTLIEVPPAPALERITPLKSRSISGLIAEELAQGHDDPSYTAALDYAILLARKLS